MPVISSLGKSSVLMLSSTECFCI